MRVFVAAELLLACFCVTLFAASTPVSVVIDADGSPESLVAIATLLSHPQGATQLSLITLTGTRWCHLAAAARNVRGILQLHQRTDVTLARGARHPIRHRWNATERKRSCVVNSWLPNTPEESTETTSRGQPRYSRYMADLLFGAVEEFPSASEATTENSASEALGKLLLSVDTTETSTVTYVALAGMTNLADFFQTVARPNTPLYLIAKHRLFVHIYDDGLNGVLDAEATQTVLRESSLRGVYYTPSFTESVVFNELRWSRFVTSVEQPTARFVCSMMKRQKTYQGETAFFRSRTMAPSMMVLIVTDGTLKNVMVPFRRDNVFVNLRFSYQNLFSTAESISVIPLSGDGVAKGGYLMANLSSGNDPLVTGYVIVDDSASRTLGTRNLLAEFWNIWLSIMI